MVAWIRDSSDQGALDPTWQSVVSSGPTHLSTAQNALDTGTPRALPVLARDGRRGLSFRGRTGSLIPWPRGTCCELGDFIHLASVMPMHLNARALLGRDAAWLHGFLIAAIREP